MRFTRKKSTLFCLAVEILLLLYFLLCRIFGLRLILKWPDNVAGILFVAIPIFILVKGLIYLFRQKKKVWFVSVTILSVLYLIIAPFFIMMSIWGNSRQATYFSESPQQTNRIVAIVHGDSLDDYVRIHEVVFAIFYSTKNQSGTFGEPYGEVPPKDCLIWENENRLRIDYPIDEYGESMGDSNQILLFD